MHGYSYTMWIFHRRKNYHSTRFDVYIFYWNENDLHIIVRYIPGARNAFRRCAFRVEIWCDPVIRDGKDGLFNMHVTTMEIKWLSYFSTKNRAHPKRNKKIKIRKPFPSKRYTVETPSVYLRTPKVESITLNIHATRKITPCNDEVIGKFNQIFTLSVFVFYLLFVCRFSYTIHIVVMISLIFLPSRCPYQTICLLKWVFFIGHWCKYSLMVIFISFKRSSLLMIR